MITSRLLRPLRKTRALHRNNTIEWKPLDASITRSCSCSAPLALSATNSPSIHAGRELDAERRKKRARGTIEDHAADHRTIGTAQSLFTTHSSSPGAPFFQPDGTHIFQKLVSFLRAQYPHFGFHEVLTPTIYKEELWQQSGHWANYRDDMFTVTGNSSQEPTELPIEFKDRRVQPKNIHKEPKELEEYGLKPMNCPGHCLLYKSERRSYRDLPIRYAEFSPLHRNEVSGALSGLTRVRRFHQDDGHIFCRPSQVREEINKSLAFMRLVYETLNFRDYHLVLSTRPRENYLGTVEEWDRAEDHLSAALIANFDKRWHREKGEGAFYGPKIDVILRDSDGKKHQTGTIQLDFQLPKRFELAYESPAPDLEAKGEDWKDSESRTILGQATPVMIHRAILGSLERFMALLLEHYRGQLPFWLNPNQVVILTVSDKEHVTSYAEKVRRELVGLTTEQLPRSLSTPTCTVDIDDSADTIAQKVVRAKKKRYGMICVVGERNVTGAASSHGDTVDLDVAAQPDQEKTWSLINTVKPGSQAPVQKDKGVGASFRGSPGVRLSIYQCVELIRKLNDAFA